MIPKTSELFDKAFLKALFEGMDDAVFVHPFKEEGFENFIIVNRTACERLGYTEEELLSMSPMDITVMEDVKKHGRREVRKELLDRHWEVLEGRHKKKNGETFPVEIHARLFEVDSKMMIVGVVRDVSDLKHQQTILEASELKYRTLFDSINDPVYVHYFEKDKPMTFVDVNAAACEKLGYSKEELLVLTPEGISPPHKDFDAHIDKIHQILNVNHWHVFEAMHQTKMGEVFPVEVTSHLFELEGRRAAISVVRDISEKKKTEAQLKLQFDLEQIIATVATRFTDISHFDEMLTLSLQDLGEFANADRAVYYRYDESTRIAKLTHAWQKDMISSSPLFGLELKASQYRWWSKRMFAKEMVGLADLSLLPPDAVLERQYLESAGIRSLLVLPIYTDDKFKGFMGIIYTQSSGSWGALEHKLLQTCGEIIGNAVGRKVSEELHYESEQRLAESQRVARVGHYQVDFVNNQWESSAMTDILFGIDKTYERTHEGWMNFTHPDFVKQVETHIQDVVKNVRPFDMEYKVINQHTKEELWIHDRGEVKTNDEGEVIGLFGTVQDITEQVKLREEMQEQEELMVAQSRHAAMGEMISMIAHQWRQPLGVISMHANNILADIDLETLDASTVKETMHSITKQTQHLSHTIDDFRDFFRPDKEMMRITPREIIDESLAVIGASLENFNIKVEIDCPVSSPFQTYSRELLQVFINLLKNAKEALLENEVKDKCIWIHVVEEKEYFIFNFSDNAGGIQEDTLTRIFDPYFSTKGEQSGTGLGLYMCRTIIHKHLKGTILAYNNTKGACFEVTLPKKL